MEKCECNTCDGSLCSIAKKSIFHLQNIYSCVSLLCDELFFSWENLSFAYFLVRLRHTFCAIWKIDVTFILDFMDTTLLRSFILKGPSGNTKINWVWSHQDRPAYSLYVYLRFGTVWMFSMCTPTDRIAKFTSFHSIQLTVKSGLKIQSSLR